jgi:cobalt-zinc-cadmium resistance protein CzcA
MRILFVISSLCLIVFSSRGQGLSRDRAIELALKNNFQIKSAEYQLESQRQLRKTSIDLPKTDVTLMYGQYNSYAKNDNNLTISQSIPLYALGSQGKLNRSLVASAELRKASTENELTYQVKQVYAQLAYSYSLQNLLQQQDSIFEGFYKAASARYKAGETNLLEQATAETQRNEAKNRLRQVNAEINVLRMQMKSLLNSGDLPEIEQTEFKAYDIPLTPDTTLIFSNPDLAYSRQQIDVAKSEKKFQAAKAAPDLVVGYFNQTLIGTVNPESGAIATNGQRFSGFQVGVSIPLWFGPHQGRVKAAELNARAAESSYASEKLRMLTLIEQAVQEFQKNKASLEYYQTSALPNADLILKQSQAGFRGGDIAYTEYLLGLRNAIGIRENYLKTLNDYNQSIIYIEFLSGNK